MFTIKTTLQTVRHFCRWLFEQGLLRADWHKTIKLPQTPPPAPKAIRSDIVQALIDAANQTPEEWTRARDVAILYFMRDTGCRIGGLLNARMAGIDLRRGTVETFEKGKNVTLYINAPTISALVRWLKYRVEMNPETDHVFISKKTRQGLTRTGIERLLCRVALRAGVAERTNPHAWRHAFARDFLLNGGELTQLAGIMHHSSIWVTTNYYARWDFRELKEAHTKASPVHSIKQKEV